MVELLVLHLHHTLRGLPHHGLVAVPVNGLIAWVSIQIHTNMLATNNNYINTTISLNLCHTKNKNLLNRSK